MRYINMIVIHCADTPAEMDIGAEEIRRWHTDPPPQGRGWSDIGYHFVIRRNGEIENGRDVGVVGAHVHGFNQHSIGICMVGGKPEANFTKEQWNTLADLVEELHIRYPNAKILGHNNLNSLKTCPTFDAIAWWNEYGMAE